MENQRRTNSKHPSAFRDPATHRYVTALGALDKAAEPSPVVASTAAAAAEDVVRLKEVWNKYGPSPEDGSAGGRLRRIVAELARLLPWRRRRLNGAMIAAINRNTEVTRALIDATQNFQAHVVWYAQTVAAIAATGRRGAATPEGIEAVQRALSALAGDWMQQWESLGTREQRFDARVDALTKAYTSVLEVTSLTQQSTASLKRALEVLASQQGRVADAGSGQSGTAQAGVPAVAPAGPGVDTNAFKYLAFEDRYRGSREEIRARLSEYVPLFQGASNVLDVGCGRGELLGLLRDAGISARGIDVNEEMVETCRARGFTADCVDALTFLTAQPDQSLGGLMAIQVVEHLESGYLMRLIETVHQKLKPGARLVLETINTACWAAFFDSYIRDFTHVHPLHPDTLRYLVQASGFATVDLKFLSPIAEHHKLPVVKVVGEEDATPTVVELIEALNAHADRLNSQLFTYRDYAIIARR